MTSLRDEQAYGIVAYNTNDCIPRSHNDPRQEPDQHRQAYGSNSADVDPGRTLNTNLADALAPLFAAIGVGYVWARLKRPYNTELISGLVTNIGAPCLVFGALSSLQLSARAIRDIAGAAAFGLVLCAVLGLLALRVWNLPLRTYLPPLIFGNVGNMGLAICFFAFGKEGLALAIVFYAVISVTMFTLGTWLWSGASHPAVLLRVPVVYAVVLGILASLLHWQVPDWIDGTVNLIGQFTIPLMLITLGVSLARLKIQSLRRVTTVAVLRLAMGFGVGVFLAEMLGLRGAARGVVIIQSTMPAAVFNYLFSARYNREPQEVAGVVVASTLLSLLTLPALLSFL